MADPPALASLIARLENASEGSRDLDADIAEFGLGCPVLRGPRYRRSITWRYVPLSASDNRWAVLPHWTDSLDAAMALVRLDDDIDFYEIFNDSGCWFVSFETMIEGGRYLETRTEAGSEYAALLFCRKYFQHLSALRARAARA